MDDEKNDFEAAFTHDKPEKKEDEAAAPDPEVKEATEEKPDEDAEAEPEKEPEKEPDPEADEDPQEPDKSAKEPIPKEDFKGYIDEKFKRQEAEKRELALQAQIDALKANQEQTRELPKRPDAFDDPDGARAFDDAKHAADLLDAKLNMSELMATQEFGAEKVREAQTTFRLLPLHEQQRIQASQHPYRELISERDNKGVLDLIAEAGGLDKLIDLKLAERDNKDTTISETIAEAKDKTKDKPPPSLSKGGHAQKGEVEKTDEEEFEGVFPQ